jgi:hypothetical protein
VHFSTLLFAWRARRPIGAAIRPLIDSLGGASRPSPASNPVADLGILSFLAPQTLQPSFNPQRALAANQEIELNTEVLW